MSSPFTQSANNRHRTHAHAHTFIRAVFITRLFFCISRATNLTRSLPCSILQYYSALRHSVNLKKLLQQIWYEINNPAELEPPLINPNHPHLTAKCSNPWNWQISEWALCPPENGSCLIIYAFAERPSSTQTHTHTHEIIVCVHCTYKTANNTLD